MTLKAVCKHCTRPITLVKTGKHTHKWVTAGNPRRWLCFAPGFPVRTHEPADGMITGTA